MEKRTIRPGTTLGSVTPRLLPRAALGLVVAMVVGAGCSPSHAPAESTARTQEPIYSDSQVDKTPQFAAVGIVSVFKAPGCTGTLIAPDLVLTAAHCFAEFARGCYAGEPQPSLAQRKQDLLFGHLPYLFLISATGLVDSASKSYPIDDITIPPAAYIDAGTCPTCSGSTCVKSCPASDPSCVNCASSDSAGGPGGNAESDIAIVHLATAVAADIATPIQVVTDVSDPSPRSGTPWIHLNLNTTTDFASGTQVRPTIVGWGDADSCTVERRSGQALFTTDPVNWDQTCGQSWSCEGPANSNACNLSGLSGDQQITAMYIHRALPSGPVVGEGDSGGPLIVAGGTGLNDGGGGFSDVASNTPIILGVLTRGGGGSPCGQTLVDGQDYPMIYSATFMPVNAKWIEQTLDDFDGDGTPNQIDNCPTVANYSQQDTNFDAELELDLGNNCSSPPALLGGCGLNPGHVPTKTDTPDYIGHFHAQYHGDACDMNATTAAVPARVRDPLGRTAPCIRCTIIGSGGSCGTTSQVCPAFLTSGISFNSYIGNSLGNAQATPGTSAPSFCQCPGADTDPNWHVDCQTQKSAPQCTIASDILFPSGQLNQSGSGWFPISEAGTVSRADQLPFPALATTHQEFSDDTSGANGPYNPNLGALATWDFPANLGEFSQLASAKSLTGVLWGHVVSFTPQPQTNPQPLVNTPNSYVPSTVSLEGETLFTVFNVRYAPVSGIWEEGGSAVNLGDPPWETIVAGVSTPIEQTIAGEARLAGERFDSAGLSLLTGVGAGTSDLLVGDDVITGVPFRSNLVAAVVVDHGTTNVHGAFTVSPIGQVTTVTGGRTTFAADPPDLRSYDANDALLRSLHVDTSGASVTVLDVQAALAGVTSTATMSVTGAAPRTPLALAWNGAEASLYVVDAMPSGAKDMALRLLRIDRKYGSRELWRLEGVRKLPDAVLLSMSPQNERVLGIVSEGHSEVAAFDSVGSPQWSLSVAGDFAAAPISTESGASLALRRHKDTSRGLLKLRFVSRGKAANHLCGTHWLRQHVITSPRSVLGDPSVECGEEHQDEDDGDD